MLKQLLGSVWGKPSRDEGASATPAGEPGEAFRRSFAQAGEDMIVDFVFRAIGVDKPTYLDIGAHHPTHLSNTQFFYATGSRGVNVEPDPDLFAAFPAQRPEDTNLNIGIGDGGGASLPFHVMSTRTLNTFSSEEAKRYAETGLHRIERVIDVPVVNINDVIARHFGGKAPDFLSVDVEGLDVEIVKSLDLSRYRPVVMCVETLTFSETREEVKLSEVGEYLAGHGYFPYADTYINTIFVDNSRWRNR
ncbi:FkbM family methyltransferase [Cupriavidus plantarum]|uniref:FkbM family methyltransferase n=1 Tax=Cupriavidus plantarum TaxID=942865 RepID=A0A316F3B7_9BURK|nr:FkbM family methyltransferase [Cupriavidus plantarum]PWK38308.1 FkbM family methyltransferase [Cupriavidus plantarum]REE91961.1 FkbM family methyltransferase [Cupriavidus plantarum]CAG2127498.1 hypothetical protein LMG26296_00536 [Cupriavidus plantarum]SMR67323.1 methyltransferase, FkbM family [Cupriavidus plantarum]